MASYLLKVPDDEMARWKAAAKDRGYYSFAEFLRTCVDAELAGSRPAPKKPKGKAGRARTEMCEHRRRPDEYCSRCDA